MIISLKLFLTVINFSCKNIVYDKTKNLEKNISISNIKLIDIFKKSCLLGRLSSCNNSYIVKQPSYLKKHNLKDSDITILKKGVKDAFNEKFFQTNIKKEDLKKIMYINPIFWKEINLNFIEKNIEEKRYILFSNDPLNQKEYFNDNLNKQETKFSNLCKQQNISRLPTFFFLEFVYVIQNNYIYVSREYFIEEWEKELEKDGIFGIAFPKEQFEELNKNGLIKQAEKVKKNNEEYKTKFKKIEDIKDYNLFYNYVNELT